MSHKFLVALLLVLILLTLAPTAGATFAGQDTLTTTGYLRNYGTGEEIGNYTATGSYSRTAGEDGYLLVDMRPINKLNFTLTLNDGTVLQGWAMKESTGFLGLDKKFTYNLDGVTRSRTTRNTQAGYEGYVCLGLCNVANQTSNAGIFLYMGLPYDPANMENYPIIYECSPETLPIKFEATGDSASAYEVHEYSFSDYLEQPVDAGGNWAIWDIIDKIKGFIGTVLEILAMGVVLIPELIAIFKLVFIDNLLLTFAIFEGFLMVKSLDKSQDIIQCIWAFVEGNIKFVEAIISGLNYFASFFVSIAQTLRTLWPF